MGDENFRKPSRASKKTAVQRRDGPFKEQKNVWKCGSSGV